MNMKKTIFRYFNKNYILKYLLSLIGLFMLQNRAAAQTDDYGDKKKSTVAIPGNPSPTAASLGQYANNIVSDFTGLPSISVPIYEINVDEFKLPISLSYNPSGIKVSDIASWVGTGWSLNCGGVITRNVMDNPDDGLYPFFNGWLDYNYIIPAWTWVPESGIRKEGYSPEIGNDNAIGLAELRADGNRDTEPDIFYFNFNGHMGKFFFNQGSDPVKHTGQIPRDQHTINVIPYQDLKFSYTLNTSGNKDLSSFTVIDESGNTYYFDKAETTIEYSGGSSFFTLSSVPVEPSGYDSHRSYKSSWYLSKIITARNKEIKFSYVTETYEQHFPLTYTVRSFQPITSGGKVSNIDCSTDYNSSNYSYASTRHYNSKYSIHDNKIEGLRLSSIETDNIKLVFDADESRQDLASAFALTGITVYAKNPVGVLSFIKKTKFDYSYMQGPTEPLPSHAADYGDPNKRLRLDKVTEMNLSGEALSPYAFEYDNTYALPNRYSLQQDFWGYFNNNACKTLIPSVYIYPEEVNRFSLFRKSNYDDLEFIINGADRSSNPAAILAGTLKKITFPLGGYEEFKWGSNVFYHEGRNIFGGGLRLEKSTRYDGVNHLHDIVHEYTYNKTSDPQKSSGVLFNLPIFTYTENFFPYWANNTYTPRATGEFDPETFIYYTYNLVITSAPNYTLSGYDGVNVGYSEITEHTPNNGYITRQYSTPGRAFDLDDNPNGTYCNAADNGYCDGLFKVGEVKDYNLPNNCIDHYGLEFTPNGYPFAPKTNYDWNRGLLLAENYFSEQGKPIQEIKNDYIIYTPQKKAPLYIYGLRKARMTNYKIYAADCGGTGDGPFYFDVVAQYPVITNVAKVLSKTTIKTYNSLNNDEVISMVDYKYSDNQLQRSEIATTTNTNERINKRYFYPLDYVLNDAVTSSDNLTQGIKNLRKKHIINVPILSYTEKQDAAGGNSSILGGEFWQYSISNPFPEKYYTIETGNPISGMGQMEASNDIVSVPNAFALKSSFKFTINGEMTENSQYDKIFNGYQWGYNNQYVIAKVTNAKGSSGQGGEEFYYEGFEDVNMPFAVFGEFAHTGDGFRYGSSYTVNWLPPNNRNYVISYWYRIVGNLWKYKQTVYTGPSLTLTGGEAYDDICIYPSNAQITTYTHKPLVGMTSQTDAKGMTTYYEYDAFQRLKTVKDQNGNILKQTEYHFKN
jgi:YD repeat-containing protein